MRLQLRKRNQLNSGTYCRAVQFWHGIGRAQSSQKICLKQQSLLSCGHRHQAKSGMGSRICSLTTNTIRPLNAENHPQDHPLAIRDTLPRFTCIQRWLQVTAMAPLTADAPPKRPAMAFAWRTHLHTGHAHDRSASDDPQRLQPGSPHRVVITLLLHQVLRNADHHLGSEIDCTLNHCRLSIRKQGYAIM